MPKNQTYDVTPSGWADLGPNHRQRVLSHVVRTKIYESFTVSRDGLFLVAHRDMKGAIGALYTLLERVAKETPVERDLKTELAELACGDSSCLFWPADVSRGMTTNAGCRCFSSIEQGARLKIHQMLRIFQSLAKEREI